MVVGICTLSLRIAGSRSLKDKRQVLRSIQAKVRNQFNVSIAEVDNQDSWQLATLALACVSSDRGYAHALLERVVQFVDSGRFDLELLDYETEFL
ncbi:MAG: DUF503 domain-containing protein [Anaerolineae bacterium]|nr:DUF503 domain-containing protein [Anaerolineae bacterium]